MILLNELQKKLIFLIALILATNAPTIAWAATVNTMLTFNGSNGAAPTSGNLLYLNGTVFAATFGGGGSDLGAVTSLTTDGQGTSAVLYAFSGTDGAHPNGSLVADAQGNLYGSTQAGGSNNFGTIFKLVNPHSSSVPWKLVTLRSFGCSDGAYPMAGVTLGPDGALYGTTYGQGAGCTAANYGAVWKLSSAGVFKIMHAFTGMQLPSPPNYVQPDGGYPKSNIVLDPTGVMIGTTSLGIPYNGAGQLFAISPSGTFTPVIYFSHYYETGPIGNIVRDSAGNVYGTLPTSTGDAGPLGAVVYKVTAVTHQLIYLAYIPGQFSESGVVLDKAGYLYGTVTGYQYQDPNWRVTIGNPARSGGGVFSVSPSGAVSTLASLGFDNQGPVGGVVPDNAGNLWGTSSAGGVRCSTNPTTSGCGTIFEITP